MLENLFFRSRELQGDITAAMVMRTAPAATCCSDPDLWKEEGLLHHFLCEQKALCG